MSEIIKITPSNIVSILKHPGSGLAGLKPFQQQIFLIEVKVAGSYYVDNIEELAENISVGTKLRLVREPKNPHDELAILVHDEGGNKLGYVPRRDNPIIARLMDAGKLIYGTVTKKLQRDDFIQIEMKIYLED